MSAQPNPIRRFQFGPFAYDPRSGSLTKFGSSVRLQGQPQQILSILVERPGEVITREELQH